MVQTGYGGIIRVPGNVGALVDMDMGFRKFES